MTTISSQTMVSLDTTHLACNATKTLDDTQGLVLEVISEQLNITLDGPDLTFIPKGKRNNPQGGKTQEGQATRSKTSSSSIPKKDPPTKGGANSPIKSSGTSSRDNATGTSKDTTRAR